MAARTLRPRHQDEIRDKIQTSQLINKLQKHALSDDESEITSSRMKAIEILLRKTLPDLTATELSSDPDNPLITSITVKVIEP